MDGSSLLVSRLPRPLTLDLLNNTDDRITTMNAFEGKIVDFVPL